ncbi:MAG TPA: NifU N-terminal domain-containing protein [Tepidisphaeraceae bacterium]|jgi:hypothetical protein
MSLRVREVQPTPNPNAMKFVLDQVVSDGTISFLQAEQARSHPLAHELFRIEGVSGLMLLGDFITVTKKPDSDWKAITVRVKNVLGSFKEPS